MEEKSRILSAKVKELEIRVEKFEEKFKDEV